MTAMMKEKLNNRLGGEVIRDIVLKAGKVATPAVEAPEEPIAATPLTPQQQEMIETQAALIADPETRQALVELMQAFMAQPR